jgi:hypothetical protein
MNSQAFVLILSLALICLKFIQKLSSNSILDNDKILEDALIDFDNSTSDFEDVFRTKSLFEFIYYPPVGIAGFIKGWIVG